MASYSIPEQIIGVPLFVPDGHDFFSIDSGGMPNGDDCLVVHGDVSADYKAFQPAQSWMSGYTATPIAMTFWINASSSRTANRMVIGVTTSAFTGVPNSPSNQATIRLSSNVTTSTALQVERKGNLTTPAGNIFSVVCPNVFLSDWVMVTVNFPATSATTGGAAADLATFTTDAQGASGGATGSRYFCIGHYGGTDLGLDIEHRIGKIAFHDHHLNDTERALLYNTMMGI